MRYIADLHIHSKYSRACSRDLDLEHNDMWARKKGIGIVGTGDFTHPAWLKELKEKLVEEKPGLFKLKGTRLASGDSRRTDGAVLFMLTTELSCIYSQGGKVRRIHLCIFVPDFKTADKIIAELEARKVNLKSDGRPIMGLTAETLTKIVMDANPRAMVVPAHAWTPWFSVFGSNSGFDTVQECFGSMSKHIYAIETGLSSDPAMNWRLSALDKYTLLSNSDAHSPANLGREANAFDIPESELSYDEIYRIIKKKDKKRFLYTIEFFPEEGKYHYDGHRACDVSFAPPETKKHGGRCPVCKKPLTVGVMYRVDQLADRADGFTGNMIPFKNTVPLQEIIGWSIGVGKSSKKVQAMYEDIVAKGGSEFAVLLDVPLDDLKKIAPLEIVQAISNVRAGKVRAIPGYDGVYGIIKVLGESTKVKPQQRALL